MVVIPMSTFEKPITDVAYESRCIQFDAERAAKMGEPPEKACSWIYGSPQYWLWIRTYDDTQFLCRRRNG